MPLFLLTCIDRTDAGDLRSRTRAAHLDYLKTAPISMRIAGPIFDDQGQMMGSHFVLEAQDRAAVEQFTADDPYGRAGLFARTEILSWRVTIGSIG